MADKQLICNSEFFALLKPSFGVERILIGIYVVRQNRAALTKEPFAAHILSCLFTAPDNISRIFLITTRITAW